jgi:glycosyltransferase involved in cell wall biosynthesis
MTTKPRIVAFSTSYVPYVGGVEIALRQVSARLRHEFDFLIITGRYDRRLPKADQIEEVPVWRVGIGHALDKWLLPVAALWIRRRIEVDPGRQHQLLWGLDITQASLSAAFIRRLDDHSPFLLTIQYGESRERLENGRMGMIRRSLRFMLSQADRVTAISTPLAGYATGHGYLEPVAIIPNGVDPSLFQRSDLNHVAHPPTVLCVSRLVRKNGIDVLLHAISRIRRALPELKCHIIGDGVERRRLEDLTRQLNLTANVRFLGEMAHRAIVQQMGESDVFVRPSRSEGMGTAFVEAMAFGIPVVGTRVGGIEDVIIDNETGLTATVDHPAELAEQLMHLLTDPELARRLAGKAQAWVREHHDIDNIARRYGDLFREMLG